MKTLILLLILSLPLTSYADLIISGKITISKNGKTSTIEVDDDGNLYVTGEGFKHEGRVIRVPSDTTYITAGGGITVTDSIMCIEGDGGAIDITANPQIADGYEGQEVTLYGNSDTNTVKFEDGNGLKMKGGVYFLLGLNDNISFQYNSNQDIWRNTGRADVIN